MYTDGRQDKKSISNPTLIQRSERMFKYMKKGSQNNRESILSDIATKKYYDEFGDIYAIIWDEQIHTGFFERKKTLKEAVRDTNKFLAEEADIQPGLTVLTAGCGRGGTDRFLVKERGARVIGIDLSRSQLKQATRQAKLEGLQDKIHYLQGSMTAIPIADESVDRVWAQESFFHCHNKRKAISEFKRVLTRNGLVVLEDTLLAAANAKEEVLEKFGRRVKIKEILTLKEYENLFAGQGFQLVKTYDFSANLAQTYSAVIEYIEQNRALLQNKIYPSHHQKIETAFGFPDSLSLVTEGKLGCYVCIFRPKILIN